MNHSQESITKCDGIITNCNSLVYYKVQRTVLTNCDSFFVTKVRYGLLQIVTGITKCDDYCKLRQYKDQFVTENPKGGITENFGRIQRGDHSDLLGK